MLASFLDTLARDFFLINSELAKAFLALQILCSNGWTSPTTQYKIWTQPFVADKLAMLLVLAEQRDKEKNGGKVQRP